MVINHSIDFLSDAKHLSMVDIYAFIAFLGEAVWLHT